MIRFGLFIIGDEILSGKRQDKHLAKVIELMAARGLQLSWARYLGDDRADLVAALRQSFASEDVVFSCGGIGATPDDHTRQAAAAALDRPLVLHPEARALIQSRILEMAEEGKAPRDLTAPENLQRLKMGEFPQGARIVSNPFNKIPGFNVGQHWFVPGFPVMAWPMIEAVLDQHYAEHFHAEARADQSMQVLDLAESTLAPLMEEVERLFPAVKVYSLPSVGADGSRRPIELGVKGPSSGLDSAFERLRQGVLALGGRLD